MPAKKEKKEAPVVSVSEGADGAVAVNVAADSALAAEATPAPAGDVSRDLEPISTEEASGAALVNGVYVLIPHGPVTIATYADGSQRIL